MTKPGLPICQHIAVGADLQQMRNQLIQIAILLGNAYPKSSPVARQADSALRAVDELRSRLDNVSATENPGDRDWSTGIYYGNDQEFWEREVPPILARHQGAEPTCICMQ